MPGLFGARRFPQIDPMVAAGVAQERPGFGGDFTPQPQPQRRRGLGTRLFGEGWEGKLSALGGLLMGDQNAVSDYHALGQQMDLKEAMRQRERTDDFEDWRRREEWERANPTPSTAQPYRFEDNAGNVWEVGPTGPPRRIFTDTVPRYYVQGDQAVQIGNPYAADAPDVIDEDLWNTGTPVGGAATPAQRPFADPFRGPGTVTSGRRTPEGNRLVGGVPNSRHLTGEAVDVVGTDRRSLQQYYGPNANVDWHRNHWHVEVPGAQFPYHGRRGTAGLRNR